ncbi:XDD4 family exosortase-dependent surface protein [Stieleria sp.]|uniref:XDD4 family exosortase-dependent surface protein n=1 Tax=Stieleria sp. TaxID=2795976 RepID=UPI003564ADFB
MKFLTKSRHLRATAFSVATTLCLGLTSSLQAGIIYETPLNSTVGPDNKSVSARATFTAESSSLLKIELENTATDGKGNITRLTNLEFNVFDSTTWSLVTPTSSSGSVKVKTGSSIINGFTPAGPDSTDISGGWMFGKNVQPAGFTEVFDYGISSTAFNSGNQLARFDGSTNFGNYTDGFGNNWKSVNGGDWGLIPDDPTPDTYTGPSVRDTVIITLDVVGTLNLSDIKNVVFTYGSETAGVYGMVPGQAPPPNMVPEPASFTILLAGLLCCGVVRRRRKSHTPNFSTR